MAEGSVRWRADSGSAVTGGSLAAEAVAEGGLVVKSGGLVVSSGG